MIDTAQLREALDFFHIGNNVLGRRQDNSPNYWLTIQDAAREFLSLREAGALIITPDEALLERLADVICKNHCGFEDTHDPDLDTAKAVLDALRDAKPDGTP